MKILAVIAARGGSKGLPRKNVLKLNGKPLIAYSIEAALGCDLITKTVVSTEDKEIAEVSKKYGADVVERPMALAEDESSSEDVVQHAIDHLRAAEGFLPDIIILLQPTSPLRNSKDIHRSIEIFNSADADTVVSVNEMVHSPYWAFEIGKNNLLKPLFKDSMSKRRQDLPKVYIPNGAIYVTSLDFFLKNKTFYSTRTAPIIMPVKNSVDIDTKLDFQLAEILVKE